LKIGFENIEKLVPYLYTNLNDPSQLSLNTKLRFLREHLIPPKLRLPDSSYKSLKHELKLTLSNNSHPLHESIIYDFKKTKIPFKLLWLAESQGQIHTHNY
jgi:hypothetical protein